jgi:hypothetical protein
VWQSRVVPESLDGAGEPRRREGPRQVSSDVLDGKGAEPHLRSTLFRSVVVGKWESVEVDPHPTAAV